MLSGREFTFLGLFRQAKRREVSALARPALKKRAVLDVVWAGSQASFKKNSHLIECQNLPAVKDWSEHGYCSNGQRLHETSRKATVQELPTGWCSVAC